MKDHIPKRIFYLLTITSFIGFLDATYLLIKHYSNTPLSCLINQGCEQVINSQYATIFNIPVALLGILYYIFFIILLYYLNKKGNKILLPLLLITAIGFIVSIGLVYLQLFVIRAICPFCMLSAITSTTLFLTILIVSLSSRRKRREDSEITSTSDTLEVS